MAIENVIWIEHRDRELGFAKELAKVLLKNGLGSTLILSIPFHLPLAIFYSPKRCFLPFIKDNEDIAISLFLRRPTEIYSLNFEQLLGYFNRDQKKPDSQEINHFFWYEDFLSILDYWQIPSDVAVKIPSPESLLITDKAVVNFLEKNNKIKTDIIFFPDNYSWAFANDALLMKKIKSGFESDKVYNLREYARASLKKFVEEILAVAQKYKKVIFVIRPHPSVSEDEYRNILGNVSGNVVVSKYLSAWDWVGGATGVISGWSTVAYSAYLLGKPAALYIPIPIISELDVDWVRKMPSHQSLEGAVKEILSKNGEDTECEFSRREVDFSDFVRYIKTSPLIASYNSRSFLKVIYEYLRVSIVTLIRYIGLVFPFKGVRCLSVYKYDFVWPVKTDNK